MLVWLKLLVPAVLLPLLVVLITFRSCPAVADKALPASMVPPMLFRSLLALADTTSPVTRPARLLMLLALICTTLRPAMVPLLVIAKERVAFEPTGT